MNNIVVLLIVGIVIAVIVLNKKPSHKARNRELYLNKLAKFLGSTVEKIEGEESYRINFIFKDRQFIFLDIEDELFQSRTFRGILKAVLTDNFSLRFTENPRARLRSNINTIADSVSVGGSSPAQVYVPKELREFSVSTTHPRIADAMLRDEKIVKIFQRFKNCDSRGFYTMSMEIIEGEVRLTFHPPTGHRPALFDLQNNVSIVESYLELVLIILKKYDDVKD